MKKELLSPAGDFETLKQAIHNGCDAVYLGGKRFGARKFALNFDEKEIVQAIKYCHLYGVKIYVTVNTVIFDSEVEDCLEYLTFLHKNGVDAVIMQDIGMISLSRKVLPNLEIHVSTQAHTHNNKQIKLLESLGVTRVVVAREMSLKEIQELDTHLEIEAFIHGALCVCYSGQCLFSKLLLNRSGNRGECAGICRLPFTLLENGEEVKTEGSYLLSPRELNTTNHIQELLESNITSFKIEGRMKSPATIGFITKLYRMLIDHYERGEKTILTQQEQEKLMLLFNRGFTEGYLFHKSGQEFMNITSPNHIGIPIGKVIDVNSKKIRIKLEKKLHQGDGIRFQNEQTGMIANFIYGDRNQLISGASSGDIIELDNKIGITSKGILLKTVDANLLKELEDYSEKKIPITLKVVASLNSLFKIEISDSINSVKMEEDIIEKAIGNGTSSNRILEQLSKLGDTPFIITESNIDIQNGIFIPISKINELRRKAITKLIEIRENKKREVVIHSPILLEKQDSIHSIIITALVRNEEQLKTCLKNKVDIIYVTDISLYLKYHDYQNIYLRIDRVMTHYTDFQNERLLIGEIGSIYQYKNNNIVSSDYYLNVTNSYHVAYLRKLGVSSITLSIENTCEDIVNMVKQVGNTGLEVLIYGRLEAMIMKYCPLKMIVNQDKKICNICHNGKKYELEDRNGAKYPILQSKELTHIFYYQTLCLDSELSKLLHAGILRYRFEFFDEDANTISEVLKKYQTMLS